MTYNTTLNMWQYTFTTTDQLITPMIIFNNNAGSQTADLPLINQGIYNYNGHKDTMTNTNINNTYPDQPQPEYYTLQGIKTSADRLTPGIYICRQGTKITKILIK
jgi:hypothetical protein